MLDFLFQHDLTILLALCAFVEVFLLEVIALCLVFLDVLDVVFVIPMAKVMALLNTDNTILIFHGSTALFLMVLQNAVFVAGCPAIQAICSFLALGDRNLDSVGVWHLDFIIFVLIDLILVLFDNFDVLSDILLIEQTLVRNLHHVVQPILKMLSIIQHFYCIQNLLLFRGLDLFDHFLDCGCSKCIKLFVNDIFLLYLLE